MMDWCKLPFVNALLFSLVPKAVDAWRSGLDSKNRKKLAAAVASPAENPDLFSEGWEAALERERVLETQYDNVTVNGRNRKLVLNVVFRSAVLIFFSVQMSRRLGRMFMYSKPIEVARNL